MKTSYYANSDLDIDEHYLVGISQQDVKTYYPTVVTPPDGYMNKLAPEEWMLSLNYESYASAFAAKVLRPLDARDVWEDIHADCPDWKEPVLLCFEEPGEPCHRRLVAAWLESQLGHIAVSELGFTRGSTIDFWEASMMANPQRSLF